MPEFKRAYLIHGDDHGRIGERRARLRAVAERASGVQGVELFEGEQATAEAVAAALASLTFALGRRFVVVDGVERWKAADAALVAPALAAAGDDVTVAFFAREEARLAVPDELVRAVRDIGGDVRAETTVKPWELPKWVSARAAEQGLELGPGAAQALVRVVGERQQRLLRELETLALALPTGGARVEVEDVETLAVGSAERKAWSLADALVARDGAAAAAAYLELRAQGERLTGLLYLVVRRLREARGVALRLEAGETPAGIRRTLRMPARAAERFIADAGRAGAESLGAAVGRLADLELATRGGATGVKHEDTRAVELIAALAA